MIGNDVPDLDVAGRRQQAAVVVVDRVAQHIIIHIGLTARFQQPDLVVVALFAEDLDGLFQPHLAAMERQVRVDDLLHPALDILNVRFRHFAAVRLVEFAEIAVGDRMLDLHLRLRTNILGSLAEQETQRPAIHAPCAGVTQVEEFDVPVVVHAEAQSLRHIVHLGRNNRVRLFEFKFRKHLFQRGPFREMLGSAGVLAVDGEHRAICVYSANLRNNPRQRQLIRVF